MSRVLIIGNGFDLYHGLPTSYMDFLFFARNWTTFKDNYLANKVDADSYQKQQIKVRLGENNRLIAETIQDFANHPNLFPEDHINYLDKNIQYNSWYIYFSRFLLDGDTWIDFESEIQSALQEVDEYYDLLPELESRALPQLSMSEHQKNVINTFSDTLSKTGVKYTNLSKGLVEKRNIEPEKLKENKLQLLTYMKKELDAFVKCLNYYISDFVSCIDCDVYSEQVAELSDIHILSFNYTYTFSSVYSEEKMIDYHSVHGEAKKENLVLGISDDSFPNTLDYVYFQKFFQRIQKRTGNDYRKWLDVPDGPIEVFVMGHSLSKVDKGILEGFFADINIERVVIFYHNQSSYENLVINLVDMFGKDFVIEKTGNGLIEFELLKPAVSGKLSSIES